MEKFGLDFDIVKNIALIEKLKCGLLSGTADLFKGMAAADLSVAEKKELLSEIIISAYLLSDKLGIEYKELNETIQNKLKAGLLDGESPLSKESSLLYQFIHKE
ncbi:MAG: MazG-like family protein [Clostridiales bacterium]|jgi:hypothetical protein|nr:MazG-like family protein [Clostridiales bacterium]